MAATVAVAVILLVPLPRVGLFDRNGAFLTRSATPTTEPRLKPSALSLVAAGNYYSVAVDGTDILALRNGKAVGRSVVVRIDPGDGKVVAASPPLYIVDGPVVVESHVWVVSAPALYSTRYQLVMLDSQTLQPRHRATVPTTNDLGQLTSGSGALLWSNDGCRLVRLDPDSGEVLATVTFPGGNCQMAVGIGDGDLIAVSETAEPPGLTVMDGRTGKVLRRLTSPMFMDGSSLAVADGYLWVADSSITLPGPVYIYRLSDLHLVRTMASPMVGCVTGKPFFGCPGWVEYADGLIWGGGGGGSDAVGCANPATFALVATAHGLDGLQDLVSIEGRVYGTYPPNPNYPNNATDIVRFTPPAACSHISRS